MLTGILQVGQLPPQCTFWRFLTSLPVTVAQQLLKLQRLLRESLGSSERTTAFDYSRYRYDGAHSLRSADGGAQELQPEE